MAGENVIVKILERLPGRRARIAVVATAGAALIMLAALLFLGLATQVGKSFQPLNVVMNDFPNVTRAETLARLGIAAQTYWTLNKSQIEENFSRIYAVKSAEVELRFPNTLILRIEPRQAIGMTMYQTASAASMFYIDSSGVIFEKGSDIPKPYFPIITIPGVNFYPGDRVPPSVARFLPTVEKLPMEIRGVISEIVIDWRMAGNYRVDMFDLIVYLRRPKVSIIITPEKFVDERYFKTLLAGVKVAEKVNLYDGDYRIEGRTDHNQSIPIIPFGGSR